jgi:hypothetical protein
MMKGNPMRNLCIAAVFAATALPALAQTPITNDLTVTMEPQRYRICNDRPARPIWVEEVNPREAYKALTLMGLYELRSWEAIVQSEDCSCEIRFPDWAAAAAEYTERFADISAPEHTQTQRALRRQTNDLRHAVQAICEAQGNW